jgi:aspartate oxidase
MEDDDYQHPNPYLSDFMPREMPITEVPNDGPSTSQEIDEEERRKRNYQEIRAVWEKLGVFKKDEENREAKKKEEAKEKEKERLKAERKANREVVTFAYSHYGQRYDNVIDNEKYK